MSARWTTAVLDPQTPAGLAVAHSPEGFLVGEEGALFPRDWLKGQGLDVLCEHGIGHFDGQPVFLLELASAGQVPSCSWRGLRTFMLEGDAETYTILGYAAQIGTWAREHRF
ncbi:NUDIX-like domain-containing protein, partial [uncultured Pseudomonas sp.]|uniref:NUDIX-like domain-containing protein n=1 Tax=uncultured Pseudomonas sp. TaxID=114707 RepID=UPI00258876B5